LVGSSFRVSSSSQILRTCSTSKGNSNYPITRVVAAANFRRDPEDDLLLYSSASYLVRKVPQSPCPLRPDVATVGLGQSLRPWALRFQVRAFFNVPVFSSGADTKQVWPTNWRLVDLPGSVDMENCWTLPRKAYGP
jgi:hypothetical protein